jgi:uncharacterized protein with PIN domain
MTERIDTKAVLAGHRGWRVRRHLHAEHEWGRAEQLWDALAQEIADREAAQSRIEALETTCHLRKDVWESAEREVLELRVRIEALESYIIKHDGRRALTALAKEEKDYPRPDEDGAL